MQVQPQSSGWTQYARKLCEKVSWVGGDFVLLPSPHSVNLIFYGRLVLVFEIQSVVPISKSWIFPFSSEEDAKIFVGKIKVDKEINLEK